MEHGHAPYDCVVVGAGVEGSATGYQLAIKGYKTVLVEQFQLGHGLGSSHGKSRITRYAYRQLHYANMMPECFQTWAKLEKDVGTKLYRQAGLLSVDGPPYKDFKLRSQALKASGKPCEILTAQQLRSRYPGFKFGSEVMAFIDPNGGVLRADRCLHALQTTFLKHGGIIKENEKVVQIIPGDNVTVVTDRGHYIAKSVVLTPGAWASKMLKPLGLHLPLEVSRIKVCYWPETREGTFSNYPCFYVLSQKYEVYGLPSDDHPGLVKVCYHRGEILNDPEETNQMKNTQEIQAIKDFINDNVPGLKPEPAVIDHCLYTSTPDEELVLDRHPDHPNIIIGCGFSGHGFKLAPAVGRILGELATGATPSYDITPMSIKRFNNNRRIVAKL